MKIEHTKSGYSRISSGCGLRSDERAAYFFENKSAEDLKLVNLLSQRVDAIRNPADRKAFFLAHPELEVRYSAKNFTK